MHLSELMSSDTEFFYRERVQYYLALGVVPRIRYDISSKIYFALQFPLELFGFGVEFGEIRNPNLSKNQQRQDGGSFDLGGEALIRLGIGYTF